MLSSPLRKDVSGDVLAKPFAENPHTVRLGLGENDEKLVATVARGKVHFPDMALDDLADLLEHETAEQVIMVVIDRLEPVHVHHDAGHLACETPAAAQLEVDLVVDRAHVVEAGEMVPVHQLLKFPVGLEQLSMGIVVTQRTFDSREQFGDPEAVCWM